jgi:hypothetical protein
LAGFVSVFADADLAVSFVGIGFAASLAGVGFSVRVLNA